MLGSFLVAINLSTGCVFIFLSLMILRMFSWMLFLPARSASQMVRFMSRRCAGGCIEVYVCVFERSSWYCRVIFAFFSALSISCMFFLHWLVRSLSLLHIPNVVIASI